MATYKRLILAENEHGGPVLAICPTDAVVSAGDLVSVNGGNLVVAQKNEYIDVESVEYEMFSAITVIYDAEAVYHLRWEREESDAKS